MTAFFSGWRFPHPASLLNVPRTRVVGRPHGADSRQHLPPCELPVPSFPKGEGLSHFRLGCGPDFCIFKSMWESNPRHFIANQPRRAGPAAPSGCPDRIPLSSCPSPRSGGLDGLSRFWLDALLARPDKTGCLPSGSPPWTSAYPLVLFLRAFNEMSLALPRR